MPKWYFDCSTRMYHEMVIEADNYDQAISLAETELDNLRLEKTPDWEFDAIEELDEDGNFV